MEDGDCEADVEGRRVVVPRAPSQPTRAEREEHDRTHLPFISWCRFCVADKGVSAPHRLSEAEENGVPGLAMDYAFLGGNSDAELFSNDEQPPVGDDGSPLLPTLVMAENRHKAIYAT